MAGMYKKILVPLDGSDLAAKALPYGAEIAELSGAQLILFQVVDAELGRILMAPVGMGMSGEGGATGMGGVPVAVSSDEEESQRAIEQAKRNLDALVDSLKRRGIHAVANVDVGDPAERIVDYAVENDVDLVVMSTHGRTGVARWAYGSVAQKVLHAAACPVLIARSKV